MQLVQRGNVNKLLTPVVMATLGVSELGNQETVNLCVKENNHNKRGSFGLSSKWFFQKDITL